MYSSIKINKILFSILNALGLYHTNEEYEKWYKSLKLRNEKSWENQWEDYQIDASFFFTVADILSLPNPWIYPYDKLCVVLFNRFADLADVEAVLYIEDKLGVKINITGDIGHLTFSDLVKEQCQLR